MSDAERQMDLSRPVETDRLLTPEQTARAVAVTMAKPLLTSNRPLTGAPGVEDMIRMADWILTGSPRQRVYPFVEGNVQVLGPSVIATDNGAVINWLGVNYLPDEEIEEEETEDLGNLNPEEST